MGVFEVPRFEAGTKAMMENIVAATEAGFTTVIVGGDTATACKVYKTKDKVSTCPLVRFCLKLPSCLILVPPLPCRAARSFS